MTVDVVNSENEKVGSVELSDEVFGGRVKTDLIHESVVRANAAERRGTHATKNRALVSGSGKKPWRQKGTGRARVGEIRNPLWRKGGTVFGPQPRSYEYQLPKKVEKGALRAALTQKLRDGEVTVGRRAERRGNQDQGGGGDAAAAGHRRQGIARRREARRQAVAVGAQHRGRPDSGEQSRQRARRRQLAAPGDDPRRDREAAGGARVMKLTHVLRRPLITEKTTVIREDGRTLVFQVAMNANKIDIKKAVESLLGSKVESVRTSLAHGKFKRQGKYMGRRSDWKKAYVKLREGEKLPDFLQGA
jgi:ribosomal protein L23